MKCALHPDGHPPYKGPRKGKWRMDASSRRYFCPAYSAYVFALKRHDGVSHKEAQRVASLKAAMILAILKGKSPVTSAAAKLAPETPPPPSRPSADR